MLMRIYRTESSRRYKCHGYDVGRAWAGLAIQWEALIRRSSASLLLAGKQLLLHGPDTGGLLAFSSLLEFAINYIRD